MGVEEGRRGRMLEVDREGGYEERKRRIREEKKREKEEKKGEMKMALL